MGNTKSKMRSLSQRVNAGVSPEAEESDIPRREEASLGIVRLDYDYPPAPGDIDHPGSFGYRVYYRAVPGLSFEMCQSGKLTPEVEDEFVAAIKFLDQNMKVSAITGDCGFMFWFQPLARKYTQLPVLMSSLIQLPSLVCAFSSHEQIAIFTANSHSLDPMHDFIAEQCNVDTDDNRFVIVGCQDVPGFEAVAVGGKVDTVKVQPGILNLANDTIAKHPNIRAILLECTELPPYADALRYETGLPVYDAITCADSFIDGVQDNPLFGMNNWAEDFNGKQHKYDWKRDISRKHRHHHGYDPKALAED